MQTSPWAVATLACALAAPALADGRWQQTATDFRAKPCDPHESPLADRRLVY